MRLTFLIFLALTPAFSASDTRVAISLSDWVKTCPSIQISNDLLDQVERDSHRMVLETISRSLPRFNLNYSQRAFVDVSANQLAFAISGNISNPWLLYSDIATQKESGQVEAKRVKEERLNQELSLIEAFLDRRAQSELVEDLGPSETYLKKWAQMELSDPRITDLDFVLSASEVLFALQVARKKVRSYDEVFSRCISPPKETDITVIEPESSELETIQKKVTSTNNLDLICEAHRNLEQSRIKSINAQWIPNVAYGLTDPIYTDRNVRRDWWIGLQFSIPLGSFSKRTSLVSECELKATKESIRYLSVISEAQAVQAQIKQFRDLKKKLKAGISSQISQIGKGIIQPSNFLNQVSSYVRLQNQLAKLDSMLQTAVVRGRNL